MILQTARFVPAPPAYRQSPRPAGAFAWPYYTGFFCKMQAGARRGSVHFKEF